MFSGGNGSTGIKLRFFDKKIDAYIKSRSERRRVNRLSKFRKLVLDSNLKKIKRMISNGYYDLRYEEINDFAFVLVAENQNLMLSLFREYSIEQSLKQAIEIGDLIAVKAFTENLRTRHALNKSKIPWRMAIDTQCYEAIDTLINAGIDVRQDDNYAIIKAADVGNIEILNLLITRGAVVDTDDNLPLIKAAENGHNEVIELLCEYGANPKGRNHKAIVGAARNGHSKTVELLHKLDVDFRVGNDLPLMLAARHKQLETVEMLISFGAPYEIDLVHDDAIILKRKASMCVQTL